MNDARLGIVRLPLPDGREVALQLSFKALDSIGHIGVLERFKVLQKGRAGSQTAMAELLEVMSGGAITQADVSDAPVASYPTGVCLSALWAAWELAQYGPSGRPAADGDANPPMRRPIRWSTLFGRH